VSWCSAEAFLGSKCGFCPHVRYTKTGVALLTCITSGDNSKNQHNPDGDNSKNQMIDRDNSKKC
jgi:hypothetical protein